MAAVTAALQLLSAGDHAVVGYDCSLSTDHLFANDLPRYGISADFVALTDLEAVRGAIKPNTRIIWIETPTNPLLDVVDLRAVAAIRREANALTVVDNTFASPYCQNPLDWFDCWLLMRGIRTLGVRMRQIMANAQMIAE